MEEKRLAEGGRECPPDRVWRKTSCVCECAEASYLRRSCGIYRMNQERRPSRSGVGLIHFFWRKIERTLMRAEETGAEYQCIRQVTFHLDYCWREFGFQGKPKRYSRRPQHFDRGHSHRSHWCSLPHLQAFCLRPQRRRRPSGPWNSGRCFARSVDKVVSGIALGYLRGAWGNRGDSRWSSFSAEMDTMVVIWRHDLVLVSVGCIVAVEVEGVLEVDLVRCHKVELLFSRIFRDRNYSASEIGHGR